MQNKNNFSLIQIKLGQPVSSIVLQNSLVNTLHWIWHGLEVHTGNTGEMNG